MYKYLWKQGSVSQRMKLCVLNLTKSQERMNFLEVQLLALFSQYFTDAVVWFWYISSKIQHNFVFFIELQRADRKIIWVGKFSGYESKLHSDQLWYHYNNIYNYNNFHLENYELHKTAAKSVFRIETWHQVLSAAAAKLHTNLTTGLVLLFLTDYILLDFWRAFTS